MNAPLAAVGSGVKGALDKESEANSVTLWVCVPIYPMTGANGKAGALNSMLFRQQGDSPKLGLQDPPAYFSYSQILTI